MKNKQQYFFHLVAANHRIILQSEMYSSRAGCFTGIQSVMTHAADRSRFFMLRSENNQPYFILKAGNAKTIAVSETYSSLAACKKGIAAVMKCAKSGIFRMLFSKKK